MRVEVKLPQWGMGMTDGTVIQWHRSLGDPVTEGEPLALIEAAKMSTELEAPESGVLTEILVAPGATVEIYTTLAIIEAPD
ncbi:MAG TPA: lipoyl domain-containing protein [Candidatus Acidoferrales bacterium]|nr:lipoyl domain-containing protein [Candidatus Acidoferrales bacterium]